jgi:signal-transduction protein with cAMP-binding, CBS, and nucleotidyltransferase domain
MGTSVRDVMTATPVTISASASIAEAAQAMRDSDIGDVIVLEESDEICGIVTDRDIALRAVAEARDATQTKVGDICSRGLVALSPDDSTGDAVRLMREKAVRRLPVVEAGKPVGIVSIGDLAIELDRDSALADISATKPNN